MDQHVVTANASAFVPATHESQAVVHVGRTPIQIDAPRPLHPAPDGPSPLHLLAAAVAADLAITTRLYTNQQYEYPGDVEVHVVISDAAGTLTLRCTVTYTEDLDDEQLVDLTDVLRRSPIASTTIALLHLDIHHTGR